jgi:hypothetical protein
MAKEKCDSNDEKDEERVFLAKDTKREKLLLL